MVSSSNLKSSKSCFHKGVRVINGKQANKKDVFFWKWQIFSSTLATRSHRLSNLSMFIDASPMGHRHHMGGWGSLFSCGFSLRLAACVRQPWWGTVGGGEGGANMEEATWEARKTLTTRVFYRHVAVALGLLILKNMVEKKWKEYVWNESPERSFIAELFFEGGVHSRHFDFCGTLVFCPAVHCVCILGIFWPCGYQARWFESPRIASGYLVVLNEGKRTLENVKEAMLNAWDEC